MFKVGSFLLSIGNRHTLINLSDIIDYEFTQAKELTGP